MTVHVYYSLCSRGHHLSGGHSEKLIHAPSAYGCVNCHDDVGYNSLVNNLTVLREMIVWICTNACVNLWKVQMVCDGYRKHVCLNSIFLSEREMKNIFSCWSISCHVYLAITIHRLVITTPRGWWQRDKELFVPLFRVQLNLNVSADMSVSSVPCSEH